MKPSAILRSPLVRLSGVCVRGGCAAVSRRGCLGRAMLASSDDVKRIAFPTDGFSAVSRDINKMRLGVELSPEEVSRLRT